MICHGHISRSSRNGVLNGSLMSPEATRIDKVQIGITHWNTNMRNFFPENSKVLRPIARTCTFAEYISFLGCRFFFPESIAICILMKYLGHSYLNCCIFYSLFKVVFCGLLVVYLTCTSASVLQLTPDHYIVQQTSQETTFIKKFKHLTNVAIYNEDDWLMKFPSPSPSAKT